VYALTEPSTDARTQLETDGYTLLRGALPPEEVADLRMAVDDVWRRHRDEAPRRGVAALHLLAFLNEDRRFLDLVDHPRALRTIVDVLGPNIFMYHCHLDVHPPEEAPSHRWMWHQDGGIQNRDLETDPRPRLSLKVAYFLTDLRDPNRGNFLVVPGSHLHNAIPRPPDDHLPGAIPILAAPGDAVVFDRRLWHMRGPNHSDRVRKALFFAYTYRWVRPRDDLRLPRAFVRGMTPAQRQLAGVDDHDPMQLWMPDRERLPVRDLLEGDAR